MPSSELPEAFVFEPSALATPAPAVLDLGTPPLALLDLPPLSLVLAAAISRLLPVSVAVPPVTFEASARRISSPRASGGAFCDVGSAVSVGVGVVGSPFLKVSTTLASPSGVASAAVRVSRALAPQAAKATSSPPLSRVWSRVWARLRLVGLVGVK